MADMMNDMLAQVGPQQEQQMQQPQQSMTPVSSAMRPGVQDATGDFITTLVELMENKGIDMDTAMAGSVEDDMDIAAGDADPLEFLSQEELVMLVEKFNALDPQAQAQLEEAFIKELPPKFVQRLRAVQRFVGGSGI
jgi:hypothetical protein